MQLLGWVGKRGAARESKVVQKQVTMEVAEKNQRKLKTSIVRNISNVMIHAKNVDVNAFLGRKMTTSNPKISYGQRYSSPL